MDAESTLETVAEIGVSLAGSAGIVGALAGDRLRYFLPRILRSQRDGVFSRVPAVDVPLHASSLAILVSQLLNTLGIGLPQSAGGFFIGLYLLLLISGLDFVYLLYVLGLTSGGPPAG
jgi:hypothetical protein